jgi:integrase
MTAAVVIKLPIKGKRPSGRKPNDAVRVREYLTEAEVQKLCSAARKRGGRYGPRDATMIWVCYRHGLRVSELIGLRWSQIDLTAERIHVKRLKGSEDSVHPLDGGELRGLREIKRGQPAGTAHVFVSERGAPMTRAGFTRMLERTATAAGLGDLRIHPHMLRHGCGYKHANDGRDTRALQLFLGHRYIQNTVRYTKLAASTFEGW